MRYIYNEFVNPNIDDPYKEKWVKNFIEKNLTDVETAEKEYDKYFEKFINDVPQAYTVIKDLTISLPNPETRKPRKGTKYWAVDPIENGMYDEDQWDDEELDFNRLKNKTVHLSKENCLKWVVFWYSLFKERN